jgi:hypothetical protein
MVSVPARVARQVVGQRLQREAEVAPHRNEDHLAQRAFGEFAVAAGRALGLDQAQRFVAAQAMSGYTGALGEFGNPHAGQLSKLGTVRSWVASGSGHFSL